MKSTKKLPQPFAFRNGYRAQISNPCTGLRETRDFANKREAQQWIHERAKEIEAHKSGYMGGPEVCTLAELLMEYACLHSIQKAGRVQEVNRINCYLEAARLHRLKIVREKTRFKLVLDNSTLSERQRAHLENLRAHLEDVTELKAYLSNQPCSLITKHDIEELMSAMNLCGNSASSIQKEIALLKSAFNTAIHSWGWTEYKNPAAGLRLGKSQVVTPVFTLQTISRLFELADTSANAQMGPMVRLAVETLIRKSRLIGLQWKNVNLEEGWCDVPAKRAARDGVEMMRIPLSQTAVDILTTLRGKKKHEYVFNELTLNIVDKLYKKIQSLMKDDAIRFHDLRHVGATLCARAGMSAHALQRLLGHKTIHMAMVYVELSSQDIRQFIDKKMGGEIFPTDKPTLKIVSRNSVAEGPRC